MRYRPELVFLLSDNITGRGKYEVDRADLLSMIDGANKDRKTKINCIQFIHPDSLNQSFERTPWDYVNGLIQELDQIAKHLVVLASSA